MKRTMIACLLVCVLLISTLAACGASSRSVLTAPAAVENSQAGTATDSGSPAGPAATSTAAPVTHDGDHEDPTDYVWDGAVTADISLNGDVIAVEGAGVTLDGSQATITAAGVYRLTGVLSDGQIVVDTQDEATVKLVLNGVDLRSTSSAPLYVASAEKVVIILADATENHVADAASYVLDAAEDEPNAALFSKADLTIFGSGSLTVAGHYNDGIAGKDGLIIAGGTIGVEAVDDGIRGKDYVIVQDGAIAVTAQGDGLKADNDEAASRGYVLIENGTLEIAAGGDGLAAQTDVTVTGGEIRITTGGGSDGRVDDGASAKGIKGTVGVRIAGGTLTLDTADDAIHSNGSVAVDGGTLLISSGDDGLHADTSLQVNAGDITVAESYEGLESAAIILNDGTIRVTASDDGLNVAGGNDGSGLLAGPGRSGGPGQRGAAGQDAFNAAGEYYLRINGGYTVVDAAGDGIDINGSVEMTDGVLLVNGPTENMNSALDFDAGFKISGGLLVAAGSAGMAQAPGTSSTQYSLLLNLRSVLGAETLVHLETGDGDEILTFAPAKEYQSLGVSSPALVEGATYDVYTGGHAGGTATDGLYQDGSYSAGTEYTSFTVSALTTLVGAGARW